MISSKNIDISIFDVFIILLDDLNLMSDLCTLTKKSFLPVMNKPILFYQLEFLERQNIKEVHLLQNNDGLEKSKSFISSYIGKIKINFIEIKSESLGTLDIFNSIKNKLTKKNFILIEGDSILSFNYDDFIDYHIDNKNLLSLVLQKKENELEKMKTFREDITEAFGIDVEENNRVVFYNKKKKEEGELALNKRIFKRFSSFNLLLNYIDLGFYIFNDAIFDIIESIKIKMESEKEEKKSSLKTINNLKEGFIPYLIKKTFSKDLNMVLIEKYHNSILKADRVKIGSKIINNDKEYCYKIYDYPSYLNIIEEIHKPYGDIKLIFFQTKNNLKNYFCNFEEKIRDNLENNKKFSDGIPEIEKFSADSYIANGIEKIEKNVVISKTVGDKNLNIQEGSKVIGCILGQNSKIGKNSKLTNCILGKFCEIGDNCNISECVIADYYKVNDNTNANQKILNESNTGIDY